MVSSSSSSAAAASQQRSADGGCSQCSVLRMSAMRWPTTAAGMTSISWEKIEMSRLENRLYAPLYIYNRICSSTLMIRIMRVSSVSRVSRALRCLDGNNSSSSGGGTRSRMVFRYYTESIDTDGSKVIETDDDLDGYWKGMESRVSNSAFRKRPSGRVGRGRVPRTDEDVWGEAGLYHCSSTCPRYKADAPIVCDHSCKKRSWQEEWLPLVHMPKVCIHILTHTISCFAMHWRQLWTWDTISVYPQCDHITIVL